MSHTPGASDDRPGPSSGRPTARPTGGAAGTPDAPGAATDVPQSAASKLFDLRLLIGGLFTLYGVLLTIYGFFTSDAELQKAAGININLWLGLGMLVLGVLFLIWARVAPLQHEAEPNPTDRRQLPGH